MNCPFFVILRYKPAKQSCEGENVCGFKIRKNSPQIKPCAVKTFCQKQKTRLSSAQPGSYDGLACDQRAHEGKMIYISSNMPLWTFCCTYFIYIFVKSIIKEFAVHHEALKQTWTKPGLLFQRRRRVLKVSCCL